MTQGGNKGPGLPVEIMDVEDVEIGDIEPPYAESGKGENVSPSYASKACDRDSGLRELVLLMP
jgi:hypothetical protein